MTALGEQAEGFEDAGLILGDEDAALFIGFEHGWFGCFASNPTSIVHGAGRIGEFSWCAGREGGQGVVSSHAAGRGRYSSTLISLSWRRACARS